MYWLQEEINKAKEFTSKLIFWALVSKKTNSKKEDQYWRDLYIVYSLRKSLEFHLIHDNLSDVELNDTLQRLREYYLRFDYDDVTFVTPKGKSYVDSITEGREEVTYPPDSFDTIYGKFVNHVCTIINQTTTTTTTTATPTTTIAPTTTVSPTTTVTPTTTAIPTTTEIPTTTLNITNVYGAFFDHSCAIVNECYGYLYNQYAAVDARGFAASGWHVPSRAEWITLDTFLASNEGGKLKETGLTFWNTPNTGATNETKFNGRGAGFRYGTTGLFVNLNIAASFATSTDAAADTLYAVTLANNTATIGTGSYFPYKYGGSYRLLKDSTTLSDGESGTYIGNDGKSYPTICIGTQEWLAQNLEETQYGNGDPIYNVIDNTTWSGLTMGACSIYNNNPALACTLPLPTPLVLEDVSYGYIYNWYTVSDALNIANTGWRVPSETDANTLLTNLGGASVAAGKMKESGLTYWDTPNTGADNSSGFNGRGAGGRNSVGTFASLKALCYVWTTTESNPTSGKYISMLNSSAASSVSGTQKVNGYSIRLVKDSTTLIDGESGFYEGNDGKIYRTICIGTQEWVADSLKETKFRTGDLVPVVTDDSAWAALLTSGRCVYDNDENYA